MTPPKVGWSEKNRSQISTTHRRSRSTRLPRVLRAPMDCLGDISLQRHHTPDGFSKLSWKLLTNVQVQCFESTTSYSKNSTNRRERKICLLHFRNGEVYPNVWLEDVLHSFADSKCSDIRDCIFGLLGVVDTGTIPPVDHSKSPVEVFYTTLAHGSPKRVDNYEIG